MTTKKDNFDTDETVNEPTVPVDDTDRAEYEEWKANRAKTTSPQVDDGVPMIVHRTTFVDGNGVQQTKEHGPMPVADWPAYEKEHKL